MREASLDDQWALVLGASSGFGVATAARLAEAGMNIIGIHLDRRGTMKNVENIVDLIENTHKRSAIFINMNAADETKRREAIETIKNNLDPTNSSKSVRILLHSLAFGTLAPLISRRDGESTITQRQMEMTLDVMGNSLVYWTQDLLTAGLLSQGSKIYGMTSAGDARVIPSYGAVSAAKAVLGAHIRQLAAELSPLGIAVNAIKAGVTATPALEKIPAADKLLSFAKEHNPSGRVTTPEDVADAILQLSLNESQWLTGNTINVDGGEDIVVV